MTPKEKAIILINNYGLKLAKIIVNEIIASVPTQPSSTETERIDAVTFWVEVKQQLTT